MFASDVSSETCEMRIEFDFFAEIFFANFLKTTEKVQLQARSPEVSHPWISRPYNFLPIIGRLSDIVISIGITATQANSLLSVFLSVFRPCYLHSSTAPHSNRCVLSRASPIGKSEL